MHFQGCHRSGNGQGKKKFFKARENSGEFYYKYGKTDILKESQEN
jgi:hypothetical protein